MDLFPFFAPYGLPGLVIAGLLVWLRRLQDRLDIEHAERLADAKAYAAALQSAANERLGDAKSYAGQALALQEAVHASVSKLGELVELITSNKTPRMGSKHD
jgi:hypothetical protein